MKNVVRILSVLLSVLLLGTCFTLCIGATDDGVDVWDGTVATEFSDKSTGEVGDPIEIRSAGELALLAERVWSLEDDSYEKCFKLVTDIDLNGKPFKMIGGTVLTGAEVYFAGDFNGNGHTIKGFIPDETVAKNGDKFEGLFGMISDGAVVRNLHVESDFETYASGSFGVIVGKAVESSIINCSVKVNAKISAYDGSATTIYIGGIVGTAEKATVIRDCTAEGTLTFDNAGVLNSKNAYKVAVVLGGIIGRVNISTEGATDEETVKIENCLNKANLKIEEARHCYVGGIFGTNNTDKQAASKDVMTVIISDCLSLGNIEADDWTGGNAWFGGIAGYAMRTTTIKNCFFKGQLTENSSDKGTIAGCYGIVGAVGTVQSVFQDCQCSYATAVPDTRYGKTGDEYKITQENCTVNVTDDTVYTAKSDAILKLIADNYTADKANTEKAEEDYNKKQEEVTTQKEEESKVPETMGKEEESKKPETVVTEEQKQPTTTEESGKESGGCGSSVGAFGTVLTVSVLLLGVYFTLRKSKER